MALGPNVTQGSAHLANSSRRDRRALRCLVGPPYQPHTALHLIGTGRCHVGPGRQYYPLRSVASSSRNRAREDWDTPRSSCARGATESGAVVDSFSSYIGRWRPPVAASAPLVAITVGLRPHGRPE